MARLSNEEFARVVDYEGLAYTIQSHVDLDNIEDTGLRLLCQIAKDALGAIEVYLEGYLEV